jgi:hypothetical protein
VATNVTHRVCGGSRGKGGTVRRLSTTVSTLLVVTVWSITTVMVSGASSAPLSSQVLSVNQLPAGWFAASDAGNTGAGCLANLLEPPGVSQTQAAEVYFVHSGDLPFLDEKLATYSNVERAFSKISRTIAACHHPSGPYKGYQVTGTVTKWSFSKEGNASIAYQMVFTTTTHLTVYYDYVIAREKNTIVALLEGDYPSVNATQFAGFVRLAMTKVTP